MLDKSLENVNLNSVLIEIYGLGYVGFPLAVKLAQNGFNVKGIDVNEYRIERLKSNKLFDSEIYLKNEFHNAIKNKKLQLEATPLKENMTKIMMICVPTPIAKMGLESDVFVKKAVNSALEFSKKGDIIILESSIEPGTTDKIAQIIESKGYRIGEDVGLCFCPERMDPANKEWGIENIPRIIYCSDNSTFEITKKIYQKVNGGNLVRVSSAVIAEVVKSFENAFRLVNISLVNELAILCDKLGINVKEVIDAAATKPFGFMPHYPGAGAGGHCIPKDPRFLISSAKRHNTEFSTISNALKINSIMPNYIVNSIKNILEKMNLEKKILVVGLSYKPNVEDMRDSPSFKIISQMRKENFIVSAYDPYYNSKFKEKYQIENDIYEIDFDILTNLDHEMIKKFSAICVVVHHTKNEKRLKEIYEKSEIPLIYDCQHRIQKINSSKTILEYLGN